MKQGYDKLNASRAKKKKNKYRCAVFYKDITNC